MKSPRGRLGNVKGVTYIFCLRIPVLLKLWHCSFSNLSVLLIFRDNKMYRQTGTKNKFGFALGHVLNDVCACMGITY